MRTFSMCSRVRIGLPILTVWLLVIGGLSRAAGQDTTVSATMLRVLAEAADQYRTGRPVFLVADYRFPHTVVGAAGNRDSAQQLIRVRMRADSGARLGVFGPYRTAPDPVSDSTPHLVSVTLNMQSPQGRHYTVVVDPDTVDALFFSQVAIDKFVLPYYGRIYGPQYATMLQRWGPVNIPGCHLRSNNCIPIPPKGYALLPGWRTEWGTPVPGVLPEGLGGPVVRVGSP